MTSQRSASRANGLSRAHVQESGSSLEWQARRFVREVIEGVLKSERRQSNETPPRSTLSWVAWRRKWMHNSTGTGQTVCFSDVQHTALCLASRVLFFIAPNVHALCVGDCFSAWSVVTNMLKSFPRFKNPLSSTVESDALHASQGDGDGALLPSTLWPDRWSSTTSVPDRTTLNSAHWWTTIAGVSCVETRRCVLIEPI